MKMNLGMAMRAYAKNDKQYFPCENGFDDNDRPNTLFFADFCVAECDGEKGIRETFKRCQEWKNDAKMWTELAVVLNHLLWSHYQDKEEVLARVYNDLWLKADEHAHTFEGDDARHYFGVTD